MIILLAAIGKNNELGKDNQLPWHLPDDLKRFKKLTLNHPIIMGRKTFESFPKPLPQRIHFVITKNLTYKIEHENVIIVHSLEQAIEQAKKLNPKIFIIGGGEIFTQSMEVATHLELTKINAQVEADVFFPNYSNYDFVLKESIYHPKDEKHKYDFEFLSYRKRVKPLCRKYIS